MFGGFLIPVLIVFGAGVFFAGLMLWAHNYVKVPPDKVAIITGRKHKLPDGRVVGYRMVRGGATFVWPVRETVQYLPLTLMTLVIDVQEAYNKDGVPVNVEAVANVKIKGEDNSIANAVERFLDNPKQIDETTKKTLEGHLRSIVGTMSIEELNSDRKAFAGKVTEESEVDLQRMGMTADSIVIKKIEDKHDYLNSLGRKRTAEVKRDAEIGEAQAKAEAKKKSSEAEREAETLAAENQRKIEEAKKSLEVKKAEYQAEINTQQAKTEQAGLLAKAEAEKAVKTAQQATLEAEAKAGVEVKKQEALRKQEELAATKVKEAEAEKLSSIAKAEGEKQAAILEAEGKKEAALREADSLRAKLQAEADGLRAKLQAEADGVRVKLVAEAEGIEKKAEAMAKLNEAAKFLLIMERSPEVIKALGEAGGEIAKGIFESVARPLGSIDNLSVYDSGNGNGHGALNRVADLVPSIVFEFMQKCKANGMGDLANLVQNLIASAGDRLSSDAPAISPNTKPLNSHDENGSAAA